MAGPVTIQRSVLLREGALLLAAWLVIAAVVSGLATGAGHRHGGPTSPHTIVALSAAPCVTADGAPPAAPADGAMERCAACLAATMAALPAAPDTADGPLGFCTLDTVLASDATPETLRRLRPPARGPPITL